MGLLPTPQLVPGSVGSVAELLLQAPAVQGEYPFSGQNKSSIWHCCGQTCLPTRIWVICSEPDLLVVLWNNLDQYCYVTNYNFCHLTQCSGGKIASLRSMRWNENSKSLVFLSACSLEIERRPKPQERWQCGFWHTTCIFKCHWALCACEYVQAPEGCVPLPSNSLWRKSLHALFLPSSWDSGVFNWLLWGQNLNKIKKSAIPQCMLWIYRLLFEQKVAGYRVENINLRRG